MVVAKLINERLTAGDRFNFWKNIDKTETCWLYKTVDKNGYGYFQWKHFNTRVPAHALMCREFYGDWQPMGGRICPHNKNCVCPFHIVDTAAPVSTRTTFATKPAHSKLTPEQVVSIREEYGDGKKITQRELALKYGVAQGVISNIIRRKRWASLETPP